MDSRNEEIARCLFRESNDALFLFDPKDHRVLDANPAALRLTGFDKDAVCALRLHDLFSSGEPLALDRLMDAYRRTGFYHSREGYFLGREAGEPIPVNVSVSRIHTTPDPLGLVVARDITERVRAQEALRESEARYRGLVETAKVIIWAVDEGGRITSLNPAFEAITGWPREAWIGQPFAGLIDPDDLPVAEDVFARTLRGEALPPFELRVRSASGAYRVAEVLSAARQTEGNRQIVAGISRDITAIKRAEEALQRAEALRRAKEAAEAADRAKSEFLGHISHEIRTPMTTVLGFTDALLEDERLRALPADVLDRLATIRRSGNHLLELINDILDLSRIEAGRMRIDQTPCSPARIVEDVAASMRPRAEAKALTLSVKLGPDVPATILSDPVRLRQILINLVSNAINFTLSGGVWARLDLDRGAGPVPELRFEVSDTGIGMSEEEVGRLFEPFYSADARTTRESGAGLGLAISRGLAEMLGGRLTVRSQLGEGSTFTLTLPVEAAEPEAPRAGAPAGAGTGAASTPQLQGRVLVADDVEPIREILALKLRRWGAEVALAQNGREAVNQALAARDAGRPFDWILMDVQMPILDGYEATRQLRARDYRGPIIALTAYATAENRDECLRFGCDDHISKPIDWDRLFEVLEAHRA